MACFTDDIGPMAYWLATSVARPASVGAFGLISKAVREGVTSSVRCMMKADLPFYGPLTGLERAGIAAVFGYGCWMASKIGVVDKVRAGAGALVPGYKRLEAAVTGKPRIVAEMASLSSSRTVYESRREGSAEQSLCAPSFQARVGYMRGGEFVVVGCCTRLNDYLIAPDHVWGTDLDEIVVFGSQSYVRLSGKERMPLDTDLSAILMTSKELSTIGISRAVVSGLPESGKHLQIVGPLGKGTQDTLKHDAHCFGRVCYEGTTLAGYSGAVYTNGVQAYAIHQCGGAVNGGFSLSWVWRRLHKTAGLTMESSEEWLVNSFKAGKKIAWDNTGDPEEVNVRIDGVYHVLDREVVYKALGEDWETKLSRGFKPKRTYGDLESSGEASSSKNPGASSGLEESQDVVQPELLSLIRELSTLSPKKLQRIRSLLQSSMQSVPAMSGPVSVLKSTKNVA